MDLDKEIMDDFRAESLGLLDELEPLIEKMEESDGSEFPVATLKEFSQKIDRIMGAAKSIHSMAPGHTAIQYLANVAEMCKTMGYQAAALQRESLVPIFAGFWADTIETMREVLQQLESEANAKAIIEKRSAHLQNRLKWLADKVAPNSEEEKAKVVALLKKL